MAGCTGRQGGAVVDALLRRDGWTVRGLTRHPDSAPARALAARGVEVVPADFDEPRSLAKAFSGCQAAFLMTDHWAHCDAGREVAQARAQFDVCAAAGVAHVVWSSLDDTRPLAAGVFQSPDGIYPVRAFGCGAWGAW